MPSSYAQPSYAQPSYDVYNKNEPPPSSSGFKYLVIGGVVLLMLVLLYLYTTEEEDDVEDFSNWVVYYREGCGYCSKQKALLPRNFKNYVQCDSNLKQTSGKKNALTCSDSKIKGFPYWYNAKTKMEKVGLQGLESLKSMGVV